MFHELQHSAGRDSRKSGCEKGFSHPPGRDSRTSRVVLGGFGSFRIEDLSSEFVITRRVQFVETDLAGVLHFSNYYRWMEEAECAFWRSLGISVIGEDDGRKVSWPRVSCSCEYRSPARFEDELEVALRVAELGNKSVTYEVEFRRDGKRTALGRSTGVCCTILDGAFRPILIPPRYRCGLERLLGSVET